MNKLKTPPYPNFCQLWRDKPKERADLFEKLMLQGKPILRIPERQRIYLVNDPDAAQRIIQHPEDVYIKTSKYLSRLSISFGQGLVTSEGRLWQKQRELLQPHFFPKHLEQFASIATTKTTAYLNEHWEPFAQKKTKFDIAKDMMHLVLSISANALFNTDFGTDTEKILSCVNFGQRFILNYFVLPPTWPSPARWYYRYLDKKFKKILTNMVEQRRAATVKPDDILTTLVTAIDPDTQELLPMDLILSQIVTLLVTGHETTGSLLAWLWYELSNHPDIYHRIIQEIDDVLQGRTVTLDDLVNLKYTRSVIDEALRMYPTIWTLHRRATRDDILCGYRIPKDSLVFVNPLTLQRDPKLWENPLKFDPERFNRDQVHERHKMAYLPFGGGHRICIGKNFALQQIQLILVTITQRFLVTVPVKERPAQLPLVSLKPRYGLKAQVQKRT